MPQADQAVRGQKFVEKAERLLRWLDVWLEELRIYGNDRKRDEIERTFFSALAGVGSLHESLLGAAKHFDLLAWRNDLQAARESDRLLKYFYKARDAEIHTDIVKWMPGHHASIAYRVIDKTRADLACGMFHNPLRPQQFLDAILRYIFAVTSMAELKEKIEKDPKPIPERLAKAGVEVKFALHGLILTEFFISGKNDRSRPVLIQLPEEDDAADLCLDYVIRKYRAKLTELVELRKEQMVQQA